MINQIQLIPIELGVGQGLLQSSGVNQDFGKGGGGGGFQVTV